MKYTGFFVCVIGIDGSGKTTLVKNFMETMNQGDVKFIYRWGKHKSLFLKFLLKLKDFFFVHSVGEAGQRKINKDLKATLMKNPGFAYIYEKLIIVHYFYQILVKFRIPLSLKKNIICDRYYYDTIVDLAYDLHYSDDRIDYWINKMLKNFPQPDILVYVNLPVETAFARKNDIPSVDFLKRKQEIYENILTFLNKNGVQASIFDGKKPISAATEEFKNLIQKKMTGRIS